MTGTSLLAYAIAVALAVATPGPAMIALIARSAARGALSGLRMALGIAIADVILGTSALLGLAALLASYAWLLTVLKYVGALYLLWLAVKMWRSPPAHGATASSATGGNVAAGLAVGLSNPKAMLFHASLMPLIVDLRFLESRIVVAMLVIIFAANLSVMSAYAVTAGTGVRHLSSRSRSRLMNRLAGGAIFGAAAAIAVR